MVAHPDDLEFGVGGGDRPLDRPGQDTSPTACSPAARPASTACTLTRRAACARQSSGESAAIVGVEQVDFLGLPDGVLEYGVALRRVIAREVRRHRPDVVLTNNFRPTWDGATLLNQADHMVTGQATLDAVRDAANRWVFPDLADEGLEPWSGVRQVWAAGSPDSKHAVDVTDTYDKGMESLRAHDAYLRGLGDFDPTEFLESFMRSAGTRLGVRYASPFEVFQVG